MVNTKSKTTTTRILVAAVAMSLLAAACGSDDTEQTVAPSTTTSTTTTGAPVSTEHPCDTGEGQIEGNYCLVDGQWYADAGAGHWVESDGPPVPTTTTTDIYGDTYTPGEIVAASEFFPEDELPDDLLCEIQEDTALSCWIVPEPLVAPATTTTVPEETTAPTTTATTTTVPEETTAPTTTATTTTVPEETTAPTTTATTTTVPEETTAPPTTVPEEEPPATPTTAPEETTAPPTTVPEETTAPPTTVPEETTAPPTTVPEETEDEPEPLAVGDVVPASELFPDDNPPDDLVCEIQTDGQPTCWTEPEDDPQNDDVWVPPVAGMVPEPLPECPDDTTTWNETCTPPSSWEEGEFEPGRLIYEMPRPTMEVLSFYEACSSTPNAPCAWLLGLMKWSLDYLGVRQSCVQGEYLDRVLAFARTGSAVGTVQNQHGWHNCATVIDPLVGQTPTTGDDVGLRLSDTGLTMADRCRAVLPEDVTLETRYGPTLSDGTARQPTRFAPGHAGCDEWANYIERRIVRTVADKYPDCYRSARLAEEWMEHHHGVHERYYGPTC